MSQQYVRREARPSQRRKEKLQRNRPFIIAGIAVAACLLLFLVVVGLTFALSSGKIVSGVTCNGVVIGGKSKADAALLLKKEFAGADNHKIKVTYGDKKWTLSGKSINLAFDFPKIVQNAYAIGRTGSFFDRLGQRFSAMNGKQSVPVASTYETAKADDITSKIQETTDQRAVPSKVVLKKGTFSAVEGKDGKVLDVPALMRRLPAALIQQQKTMEAPVVVEEMPVTLKSATKTADYANTLITLPLKVTYGKKTWDFSAQKVRTLISFINSNDLTDSDAIFDETQVKSSGAYLVPAINPDRVASVIIKGMGQQVGTPAVNAKFSTVGGKVSIVPSKNGRGADPQQLASDIEATYAGKVTPKVVAVKTTEVEPAITTAKAQKMGINERIGTYTTEFASGNKPRVENIQLLARSLDNQLIRPGGTFSFNGTVGERTAEKGYKEAGAIVDGELVNQLGGGICQVNTTLFNAVLTSGLTVSQRSNHSYYISHYPLGRDATVSWGGPDFKFKNTTDNWVLISSSYSNSSVTISLYGTDPGYEVEIGSGSWKSKKKFGTKEIVDKKLSPGTKIVESSGVDGGIVEFTRVVKKNGKIVSSQNFRSNYSPKAQVVKVGPKKKEKTPATVPPATTE